jgi:alpha-glucosidase
VPHADAMGRASAARRLHQRQTVVAGGRTAYRRRGVEPEEIDPDSTLNFARRLIHWRRQQPQLTRGEIKFFDAPEPVLALQRDLAGHPSVVAVFNLGSDPVSVKLPAVAGAVPMTGHGMPGSVNGELVTLPAYGAWFGSRN